MTHAYAHARAHAHMHTHASTHTCTHTCTCILLYMHFVGEGRLFEGRPLTSVWRKRHWCQCLWRCGRVPGPHHQLQLPVRLPVQHSNAEAGASLQAFRCRY